MYAQEVEIVNPTGLHTRPGNAFVKKAKEFTSTINVIKGEKRANAKSLLTLMKVGCSMGDHVTIEAVGPDEVDAVDGLVAFVATLKD
ncbi:HPr family phosphocarrier protein [Telmatospirillum sp.]|uniref:HPr family phosphocarrier protein n=1 Tax=Telmatospirillum sp. TaxID=2079197 RepID=UPI00284439EA|nr:HPr family phosphocarrier protein [Telmatospirillum sp.]MDR3440026.1 HPr family phosphocarrier protein [Telmatospirillum sp.]